MRSSKKALLLAVGAIVAVAAMAVPAAASASVWKYEGTPLEKHVELTLTGGEVIEVNEAVLLCETTATLTTEGGSTGRITAYEIDKGSCAGLAGSLEGCEVTEATATNLPWTVTVNSEDLTVEGLEVDHSFDSECGVESVETSFPELTLTPEPEASSIRYLRFSQSGTGKVDGKEAELGLFGTLQLSEEDSGKYGIG
jgi:hypothetical protein